MTTSRGMGFRAGLLAVAVLMLSGCATLFKGTTEAVTYNSNPPGAKVYVNGRLMGETPFQIDMESNRSYKVEFRKDGYLERTVVLNDFVDGSWVVLDVVGGLVPAAVDAATGAWCTLDQPTVNALLEARQK